MLKPPYFHSLCSGQLRHNFIFSHFMSSFFPKGSPSIELRGLSGGLFKSKWDLKASFTEDSATRFGSKSSRFILRLFDHDLLSTSLPFVGYDTTSIQSIFQDKIVNRVSHRYLFLLRNSLFSNRLYLLILLIIFPFPLIIAPMALFTFNLFINYVLSYQPFL